MIKIRDFIYLDIERLYSLYSQVFEGVADQIIQSYIDTLQSTDSQRSAPFIQASDIETKVIEVSRRTENKFLYDHMFNRLEGRVEKSILDATTLTKDNYSTVLRDSFLIKVSGNAEIEDFDSIKELIERFNFLGEAIYYISTFGRDGASRFKKQTQIEQLRTQLEATSDKNQRVRLEKSLEKTIADFQSDLRHQAISQGLGYDPTFLNYLVQLTGIYYPDRLDVTVTPYKKGSVSFRGVLDKRWLRLSPEFLRHLHSGTAVGWTMIGQVTHFPDKVEETEEINDITEDVLVDSNMRSAYNALIKQSYNLEKHFTTNVNKVELIMSPLAIFRENLVDDQEIDIDDSDARQ